MLNKINYNRYNTQYRPNHDSRYTGHQYCILIMVMEVTSQISCETKH